MIRPPILLIFVCAMMPSAVANARLFHWEVKSELDIHKKLVITINGKTPGPPIQVQQGDTIRLGVTNRLKENIAINWHGLRQIRTPLCTRSRQYGLILAGEACSYFFFADEIGEFSYESRYWMQQAAGLYGPIRVMPRGRVDRQDYA